MEPVPSNTATELEAIRDRLQTIERRLALLEGGTSFLGSTRAAPAGAPAEAAPSTRTEWLPMLGKTLVIIGGAFVLRAVTSAGVVAPPLGAALGVLYALSWYVMAARSAARGATPAAVWHGIAGTIIAFPLLYETTVKFGIFEPLPTAGTTVLVTAVGLFVAWQRRVGLLAVIVTLAAAATLVALAQGTGAPVPFVTVLLLLALATGWIGYTRGWTGPVWLAAIPAELMVLLLTGIVMKADAERAAELVSHGALVSLQLGLVVLFVGSFAVRTLRGAADIGGTELPLGLGAIAIGLGGAIAVAGEMPIVALPVGLVAAIIAAFLYALSFTLVDRSDRRRNFLFYSSVALVHAYVAALLLLPAQLLAFVLAAGAVAMAAVGAHFERATLNVHGAVYACGAAIGSGLLLLSVRAMTLPELAPQTAIGAAMPAALAGAILYCLFPVAAHGRTWGRITDLPKVLVLAVALVGTAGMLTLLIAGMLPSEGDVVHAGALAVLRTGLLAVGALALAGLARTDRLRQAAWLVYPVLVAGGIKLLIEDLRVGSPALLVASFAIYGGTLIAAPQLRRDRRRAA
jgi:hypothetical protein